MSSCDNCTATHILTNQGTNATSIANTIMTFYSDRNLKERMEFKNPKVEEYFRGLNADILQRALAKIKQMGGSQLPLSPFANAIITFYSDRNLKERMEFKNPKVEEYFRGFERSEVVGMCEPEIITNAKRQGAILAVKKMEESKKLEKL